MGIRLTLVPPRCSIWGSWNIILRQYLSLNKTSRLRKPVENIFINCGGQEDLFVLDAATEKLGPLEGSKPDVATVISKCL
jgi:hypothetical protein